MRVLPEPVALLSRCGDRVRLEDATDSFVEAIGQPGCLAQKDVRQVFGEKAAALFLAGYDAAVSGRPGAMRIPIILNGRRTSRIFMFLAQPVAGLPDACMVALERRSRATTTRPEQADATEAPSPANDHLFYIYDVRRGRTRQMNAAISARLGLAQETLTLDLILDRLHPEDRAAFQAHAAAFAGLEDGQILTATFRLRDQRGRWRAMRAKTGILDRDRHGRVRRVIGVAEDLTDHEALDVALHTAARTIQDIEIRERGRIARELHDSTAQHLVAIDLELSNLVMRTSPGALDVESLVRIRESLASAHREIRTFSYLLHPPQLERDGLETTLSAFIEGFGRRAGLWVETVMSSNLGRYPPDIELVLFRVAQEALMNVHTHARATQVWVRLHERRGSLILEVEDNGQGLDAHFKEGVGMAGMRSRLAQLRGRLTFTDHGQGLKLRASCPLRRSTKPASDPR